MRQEGLRAREPNPPILSRVRCIAWFGLLAKPAMKIPVPV